MLTNQPVPYDFCVSDPISSLLTVGSTPVKHSVLNVKALVGPSRGLLRDCENRFGSVTGRVISGPKVHSSYLQPTGQHWHRGQAQLRMSAASCFCRVKKRPR